jgi:hypothetical protein
LQNWLNLIYSSIVAKRTNEKHNCWINNLFIRLRKYVLFHVYHIGLVSCTANHKTQTLHLLLIDAYSKGERRPCNSITRTLKTSIMLSNVFKCSMLISFPKKHERLTYTRTLLEIKVELNWNAKIEIVNICGKWQLFISRWGTCASSDYRFRLHRGLLVTKWPTSFFCQTLRHYFQSLDSRWPLTWERIWK